MGHIHSLALINKYACYLTTILIHGFPVAKKAARSHVCRRCAQMKWMYTYMQKTILVDVIPVIQYSEETNRVRCKEKKESSQSQFLPYLPFFISPFYIYNLEAFYFQTFALLLLP